MGENTVSKADGDNLEFDEFELPGDGETDDVSESSAEFPDLDDLPEGPELSGVGIDAPQADEADVSETVDEPQPLGASTAVSDDSADKKADQEADAPSKSKVKLDLATLLGFGGSGLVLAALAYADLLVLGEWPLWCVGFLNLIGVCGAAIPFLLWAGRGSLNLYNVLLSITLAAILVGCCLLLLELMTYNGDFLAKEKSLQAALPSAVQAAPPNTTAVA